MLPSYWTEWYSWRKGQHVCPYFSHICPWAYALICLVIIRFGPVSSSQNHENDIILYLPSYQYSVSSVHLSHLPKPPLTPSSACISCISWLPEVDFNKRMVSLVTMNNDVLWKAPSVPPSLSLGAPAPRRSQWPLNCLHNVAFFLEYTAAIHHTVVPGCLFP